MDSITQITLGAAVGEVVLGKKAGNRAMLWGAIGGTIPDLDVIANAVTDDISALAFHRAITHSFTFAFIAPIALGWLVHRLYGSDNRDFWRAMGITGLAMFALTFLGTIFMPIPPWDVGKIGLVVSSSILAFPLLVWLREKIRRRSSKSELPDWKSWSWLLFWAIFTHPLLDACTTFGTQLFQPFWDYRVAFNNISVADPFYTLPFLICVITASIISRGKRSRVIVNYVGIGISSAYMLFCFYNKYRVNRIFEQSLQREGIAYERYMTTPLILNNILWQGVAEGDTAYYHGMYSLLDKQPKILQFNTIPKNHELLAPYAEERTVKILKWFSDGYWSVMVLPDGTLQMNDLRYGSIGERFDKPTDYIFSFHLKEENGLIQAQEGHAGPPDDAEGAFQELIERIKGK